MTTDEMEMTADEIAQLAKAFEATNPAAAQAIVAGRTADGPYRALCDAFESEYPKVYGVIVAKGTGRAKVYTGSPADQWRQLLASKCQFFTRDVAVAMAKKERPDLYGAALSETITRVSTAQPIPRGAR